MPAARGLSWRKGDPPSKALYLTYFLFAESAEGAVKKEL
jgi:hypothetical protein